MTHPLGASIVDYLGKPANDACDTAIGPKTSVSCSWGTSLNWGDWAVSGVGGAVFLALVAFQWYYDRDIQLTDAVVKVDVVDDDDAIPSFSYELEPSTPVAKVV
ncbi:Aste57867_19429 [Aphanomyces stellatus]|uniref:Aste57867_19429 protein n=1 Tax=Aphanomyces stellatus TaxID=120398 RepID=A0A485LE78_9STRA|nr:hypothetical protein As57867_019365 [Aphanomyces stellatus]VFT96143.1 Aste57867_19429 [Aphanomyces stellatus]